MADRVEKQPSEANAEQGVVLVDGPNGVALSLTPQAARKTARALIGAARVARLQRRTGISS